MIRRAMLEDVDALVAMGQRFLASTSYRAAIASSPEQMRILATAFVTDAEKVALVAEVDGQIVGMLLALVYPHYISGERIGGEVCWWVEPAARGHGLRLLRSAEQWARSQGAVKFQMIAPTPDVERIYQARHYTKLETTYQVEL